MPTVRSVTDGKTHRELYRNTVEPLPYIVVDAADRPVMK
jgi:hypothetical protein